MFMWCLKKYAALLLLLAPFAHADAPFYEVRDRSGAARLHQTRSTHSPTLARIRSRSFVYSPYPITDGWREVFHRPDQNAGWLPASRLFALDRYPSVTVQTEADGVRCQHNGNAIRISVRPLDYAAEQQHFRRNAQGSLTHYRGKALQGTDGDIPRSQIHAIRITHHGKTRLAPLAQYAHLFNPYFDQPSEFAERTACYYRAADNTLLLITAIGDGAGYADVLFATRQGSLKTVWTMAHPEG